MCVKFEAMRKWLKKGRGSRLEVRSWKERERGPGMIPRLPAGVAAEIHKRYTTDGKRLSRKKVSHLN
jgi:hypothetical protein